MRILLIRHASVAPLGHVLYGRTPGIHLNERGREEAQTLGHVLKQRYKLTAVVSSPMERALETARFIAEMQGIELSIDEDLNELAFGSWMGKTFAELNVTDEWKSYNELRSISSAPAGEFMMEVQARGWRSLARISERFQNATDTVAVVSHGDVIRALLVLFLGMPLDYIHRLEVLPASFSEVVLESRHPRVINVNQVSNPTCGQFDEKRTHGD